MPAQAWVTLIVGAVATVGVLVTWQQKNTADSRSEWWRRTTWAFERSLSDDTGEARLGWSVLDALLESKLVTKSDVSVAQVIAEYVALNEGHQHGGEADSDV
jgi:hypothetical protein